MGAIGLCLAGGIGAIIGILVTLSSENWVTCMVGAFVGDIVGMSLMSLYNYCNYKEPKNP